MPNEWAHGQPESEIQLCHFDFQIYPHLYLVLRLNIDSVFNKAIHFSKFATFACFPKIELVLETHSCNFKHELLRELVSTYFFRGSKRL
jgi:hypothetical protein